MSLKANASLVGKLITLFLLCFGRCQLVNAATELINIEGTSSNREINPPIRLFLNIEVNSRKVNGIFYAEQFPDGKLFLNEDAWSATNLSIYGNKVLMDNGQFGYDLHAVKGVNYEVDYKSQSIKINALSNVFGITDLTNQLVLANPINPSSLGVYLNYILTSTITSGTQNANNYGAFLEGVVFNQYGSVVSSMVLSNNNEQAKTIRADTYFQKDMPSSMEKLIIGDAVSSAGSWSRPIRFGGLTWSTDFSLKQGFVSAATPSINGSAALPSTVDILINNQKRQSDIVNPGPFQIINFPTVTGAGQINVVVKDILGVQTLTTQSFYSTPRLLKEGLNEFSFEVGMERINYGIESNVYDKPFIAETYRRGFDGYTLEGRTEIQDSRQALGIEVSSLIKKFAVMHLAIAGSKSEKQEGLHQVFGIERSSNNLNINMQIEHYDQEFLQIGALVNETKPRQKLLLGLGINFYKNLWISTNVISQSSWNAEKFNLASANLSIPLIENISLNAYANKQFGQNQDFTLGLNINIPLSNARSFAISSNRNAMGDLYSNIEFNQAIVDGTGIGYRVRTSDDPTQQLLASVSAKTPFNSLTVDAAKSELGSSFRLSSSGSLGLLGGLPFASQMIGHGSFAVVKVADEPNVDVYQSNRKIATTNANGLALLPNVLPYQLNNISIHPEDLPFDLDVITPSLSLMPFARSGLFVNLNVQKTNNRLVQLMKANGEPLPIGAKVHLVSSNTDFVVAKRGEVYLTGLSDENNLLVSYQGCACSVKLNAPIKNKDKNKMIIVTCRE